MKKEKSFRLSFNLFLFFFLIIGSLIICLTEKNYSKVKAGSEKEQFIVKTIKAWPEIEKSALVSVVDELGPIGFWLEVSWPMDWDEGNFQFLVNGRPALFKKGGGGFGSGFYEQDFFVYSAGEPGSKSIDVIFASDKKKAQSTVKVNFNSNGRFVPLEKADKELITGPEPFKFFSWFFKDWRVLINGIEQKLENLEIFEGVHLLSCRTELRPGINLVQFSGLNYNGERKEWSLRIFYREAGKLKPGDSFSIKYECFDTKSESTHLFI